MPSLKDVKLQIAGVKKTKQITRAMGMVASAGLRGAQQRIERFRPYANKFNTKKRKMFLFCSLLLTVVYVVPLMSI